MTQPLVPFFPAGYKPLHTDFDGWIQAPLSFLTSKIVFRAELTSALSLPSGTSTLIPFNSILEDPFSGWQSGSSQWLCPAGYNGTFEVSVTVSCAANASNPTVQPQVGINSGAFIFSVDKALVPSSTVPGIASGSVPVQLYGGVDSVQAFAFIASASGSVVTTAGQRCELVISWQSL